MQDLVSQFLWVIYPYIMMVLFIAGHFFRYQTDQIGWTSKSSEILEKNQLKWGSLLFHFGILAVLGGHMAGLLIPKEVVQSFGIDDHTYHMGAVYGGGFAGIVTFVGVLLLTLRRFGNDRVYAASSLADLTIILLLLGEISLGLFSTFSSPMNFDYRVTIAPWLRGLLTFSPIASLMENVPLTFKLHVMMGFAIFGLWPFTRLVHVWSVPIEYISRPFGQFRSRDKKYS